MSDIAERRYVTDRCDVMAPEALVLLLVIALTSLTGTAGQAWSQPPSTVASVDLNRYAGRWYEIARFPNRFQSQCAGDVTATYAVRPDGRVSVTNRCRREDGRYDEATGIARVAGRDDSNARLEVRFAPAILSFLPMVWGDYWIIDLADDYSTAVVGSPDRQYLWILARTPVLDTATWQRLVDAASREGFAVDRLERTPQGS
jgi:apolipoprotein D and lipocalin family protein